jgi:Fe-S protein assembly co-chaperone HscB
MMNRFKWIAPILIHSKRSATTGISRRILKGNCLKCGREYGNCGIGLIKCAGCGVIQDKEVVNPTYFDVFCMAPSFKLDEAKLKKQFIALQRILHPDNYVQSPDELKSATVWSSWLNRAMDTLKDSYKRAIYCFNMMSDSEYLEEKTLQSRSNEEDHKMLTTVMQERMELEDTGDLAVVTDIRENNSRNKDFAFIFLHLL